MGGNLLKNMKNNEQINAWSSYLTILFTAKLYMTIVIWI